MSNVATPEKLAILLLLNEENRQDPGVDLLKSQFEEMGYPVIFEDEEEYLARGRVADCDCQMLQCVCVEARKHKPECRWRTAILAPVGFACEHGFEECPTCDACTCEAP